ncbi:hypothetical protein [Cryobacterium arcticum]|uniref:Uncharacterized protein n=1 Tax=Cryobacterium arcticum TaxID=670052 RepID=A0A1B1BP05_9MICO|nr:hypothetical protein [Cryobacterium arcticum]ANP74390.1 hypothetical protein PA27867_3467 [Cryobacterium arcticum]
MIIWTRWGILVFVFFGLSVGLGFALKGVFAPAVGSNEPATNTFLGTGFVLGAAALWAFSKYVLPRLDKARPSFVYQQLPEPAINERGVKVTHRPVAVVNQETGQQIWTRPSSTFFFIPVRFWPYPIAAIGVVNLIIGIIGRG